MSTSASLKRKAAVQAKSAGKKRAQPARLPTPESDGLNDDGEGFEDLEDGDDHDDGAYGGVYDDPMIDRQSSGSEDGGEEDEDEDADDAVPTAGPSRTPAPAQANGSGQSSKHLYKAPTLEEMEQLRSIEQSGGTTFSLQLSALLESTLLSRTPSSSLKSLLSSIHSNLLSHPPLPPLSPVKAYKRLNASAGTHGKINVPSVSPEKWDPLKTKEDVKWTLGWDKPEEIVVAGSWAVVGGYKKGKGEAGGVDLVVVMPSAMFSAKDRMDYRYFHKRAHYLAVIFASLQQLSKADGPLSGVEIEWGLSMEDARKPVVVLKAGKAQGLKQSHDIRIHASISPNVFPLSTLTPSKSLLRTDSPTPLYSDSILHDTLHKSHLLHLHRLSQLISPDRENGRTVDSFLATWRIWATRRGLQRHRGASGWFASMLLGWVVDGGSVGGASGAREKVKKVRGVGKGLGHWGALRAAWEFLAHTDFVQTPIFMESFSEDIIPQLELIRCYTQDIFVDPTGRVNIFANWEKGDIELLQYHARETLAMLENDSADHFREVFLNDQTLGPEVFDEFIRVDSSSGKFDDDPNVRSEHPSTVDLAISSVSRILRQGLSDRAKIVHVYSRPDSTTSSTLDIGIILNPETANRVIDIGPSSDPSQAIKAEAFRQLWGEKSELRRFKDGTISESVIWELSRPEEATLIPGRITKYLLNRHFNVNVDTSNEDDDVECFSSNLDWQKIIQIPASARNAVSLPGSEKLGFRPTMNAYDELYKLLKDVDDELPLAILNVTPTSEMLRYSSTFVPHPIDVNRLPSSPYCINYVPYADVVVQFESSPKWPDDLAAIQKVKLALFEKLSRVIESRIPASTIDIVFDHNHTDIEDHAALEVLLPQGVAFRLRIFHDKEKVLLERIVYEDEPVFATSLPRPPRKLAAPALESHIRRFVHLPAHHSSIAPLHHRYPSYSSATRLLKRWFSSHMLSTQIQAEVIELIMAKMYLDPGSLAAPSSATSGFLRAIDLLSGSGSGGWDWKTEPLLVPIFSLKEAATSSPDGRVRFPSSERQEATKLFEGLRSKENASDSNAHGWIVVTEQDESGLRWTKGINKLVAGRVAMLAKATLAAVRTATGEGHLDVRSLFTTPLEHYDFLLHLSPSVLPRYPQGINSSPEVWEEKLKFRNLHTSASDEEDEIRIGFDPAESFVEDLKKIYGDAIIFFSDANGGKTIGGIWNPSKEVPRALKAFLGWNSRPVESESALVTINKEAILGELARLGKGLIDSIERRR